MNRRLRGNAGAAESGIGFSDVTRGHEGDFAGAAPGLRLHPAGKGQGLIEVEGGRAGSRGEDGRFNLAPLGFENRSRRGERIGADEHDAIDSREGAHILNGTLARRIHQCTVAGASSHPGGAIENEDMVAA
jgi:hypothetical protein